MSQTVVPQSLSWLPELDTSLSDRRETLALAVILIVSLTFVTPVLVLITGLPAFVFVVLVGVGYGALCLLTRRLFVGTLVALIVTATFYANVPLVSQARLRSLPGQLGPVLWLVHLPLIAAVVLVFLTKPREILADATKADTLFAAFIGWSVLAAVFGATMQMDTALWFSFLLFQGLVVFALLRYAVQQDVLFFETVAQVFVGIVFAQCLVAVAQFFNRGIFGVSQLGESGHRTIAPISLGPLGQYATGTYVSGFTGMSFLLATLILLAVPLAVVMAVRNDGWKRAGFVAAALIMSAVMRGTGTDAGRGALIVALVCLCIAFVFVNRGALRDWITGARTVKTTRWRVTNAVMAVVAAVIGIATLLYPSAKSGQSSSITNIETPSTSSGGSGSGSGAGSSSGSGTGAGAGGGGSVANNKLEAAESLLNGLSIPFFDLSTLGTRMHQYVVGFDLFLRYPLFGIGGANFQYYSIAYGFKNVVAMHNIYIAVLAETGLPGFVLFIGFCVAVLWAGWAGRKRPTDGLLFVGACCGLIGWFAFGFWDHTIDKMNTFLPFMALAGALVGAYSQQND